jgi:hypothetical protein
MKILVAAVAERIKKPLTSWRLFTFSYEKLLTRFAETLIDMLCHWYQRLSAVWAFSVMVRE